MEEQHRGRSTNGAPALSVVIPTHNRSGVLRATLQRLLAAPPRCPWEIVVVANACTDDTSSTVADTADGAGIPVRVVEEPRASASIARNRGARGALGSLLVFLDDDILLQPDALTTIWDWYAAGDQRSLLVGQVQPLPEHLATPFGAFRQRVLGSGAELVEPREVDWYASGVAAVPAEIFGQLGGYDETYPAAGLEDTDFAIRARRAAHGIVFHPGVVGLHNDWAGTTARDFCRRAAIHCSTAPLIARRFPDNDHPWRRLVEVNRPPDAAESLPAIARKRLKLAGVALAADRWLPVVADRVTLPRRPRELLYRLCVSLAMFGGYQRGLALLAGKAEAVGGPGADRGPKSVEPPAAAGTSAHDLTIVVVSFDCADEVEQALESLRRHPPSVSHEIIVIDNASQDDTVPRIRERFPQVRVLPLEQNLGYGSAVNIAVKEADGRFLLLLNPDTQTTPGAIDTLLRHAMTTDDVGVVGPRLLLGSETPQPSARRLPSPWRLWFEVLRLHLLLPRSARSRILGGTYSTQEDAGRVDWVSGACHLIPRSVWDQIGGLTERTFCGFDDLDYCWRAREAGLATWFCPDAVILHHCGVSVSRRWAPAEVDAVAIHNMYVVLQDHWSRSRVKLYCAAELVGTLSDLARGPRRHGLRAEAASGYRRQARARALLLSKLLSGLARPVERHEPGGRRPARSEDRGRLELRSG